MSRFAKLFFVIVFSIALLTSCSGTTPKSIEYSLNGIYALVYEITDIKGPEGYTVNKIDIAWEFSTTERVLTLVEELYPVDFDYSEVNVSSNISGNKSKLSGTFSNDEFDVTYTIDIELTSNEALSYTEVYQQKSRDGDASKDRSFTRKGTGTLQETYKLADGRYNYLLIVDTTDIPTIKPGDTIQSSLTIEGNTISAASDFTDGLVSAPIKYNQAALFEVRNSDGQTCTTLVTITSNTTFAVDYFCLNKDLETLFAGFGLYMPTAP